MWGRETRSRDRETTGGKEVGETGQGRVEVTEGRLDTSVLFVVEFSQNKDFYLIKKHLFYKFLFFL